jgi:ABC-type multidrug transport system ATPase subunit
VNAIPFFSVTNEQHQLVGPGPRVWLVHSDWNDFHEFWTKYRLVYFDEHDHKHFIGNVKIGQFEMNSHAPDLPSAFDKLNSQFFSLGTDEVYYENLESLGAEFRVRLLRSLQDAAYTKEIYDAAHTERVFWNSLTRDIPDSVVTGRFRRLAQGDVRKLEYNFHYLCPPNTNSTGFSLSFEVDPNSNPPSNVHALIGRNGVGKSFCLNSMAGGFLDEKRRDDEYTFESDTKTGQGKFNGVVLLSFSAFDSFSVPVRTDRTVRYRYVGLKRNAERAVDSWKDEAEHASESKDQGLRDSAELAKYFATSVANCIQDGLYQRWKKAIQELETDPVFRQHELTDKILEDLSTSPSEVVSLFKTFSTGHQIVLLTITKLVEYAGERTLILMDEPEGHLHPPLLSSFVRTLSNLLKELNAVAIVATHSPVVLQEIPKHCVSIINRSGMAIAVHQPEIETFGEGIGILTREVFGLEVTESGFNKLIQNKVNRGATYEEILSDFNNRLGGEAKSIAKALVLNRDSLKG